MKQIIKRNIVAPLVFVCEKCGCKYRSDEYKTMHGHPQVDVMTNLVRRQIKGYVDCCPQCNSICRVLLSKRVFVYQ